MLCALERREATLESMSGRVVGPLIFEPLVVTNRVLDVSRCLIDGYNSSTGGRIGVLARVNG